MKDPQAQYVIGQIVLTFKKQAENISNNVKAHQGNATKLDEVVVCNTSYSFVLCIVI